MCRIHMNRMSGIFHMNYRYTGAVSGRDYILAHVNCARMIHRKNQTYSSRMSKKKNRLQNCSVFPIFLL